jgi:hypothetical protein
MYVNEKLGADLVISGAGSAIFCFCPDICFSAGWGTYIWVLSINIISKTLAGESSNSMDRLQKPADLDMDVPLVCGRFAAPCFWIPMVIGAGAMGWVGLYG